MTAEEIYAAGYAAFIYGVDPQDVCPFDPQDFDREVWLEGWHAAEVVYVKEFLLKRLWIKQQGNCPWFNADNGYCRAINLACFAARCAPTYWAVLMAKLLTAKFTGTVVRLEASCSSTSTTSEAELT